MGTAYQPKIVTDGLILSLNAGDRKSYSGSGTTWKDRSGNGNNGTLVNGVGYNSANGGSLSFDGVDDYVNVGDVSNEINNTLTGLTVSVWFQNFDTTQDQIPVIQFDVGNYFFSPFYILAVNGGTFYIGLGSTYVAQINTSTSANTWVNISFVFVSSTSLIGYRNGTQDSSVLFGSIPSAIATPTADLLLCASSTSSGTRLEGALGQVQIYNRALTPQEIQQNFNALKDRFQL